jgi:hypothetical protein
MTPDSKGPLVWCLYWMHVSRYCGKAFAFGKTCYIESYDKLCDLELVSWGILGHLGQYCVFCRSQHLSLHMDFR